MELNTGMRRKIHWKRALKRVGWGVLIAFTLLNIYIIVTGKFYLYKAFANTVMVGRFGPGIHEQDIFYNRTISATAKQTDKWVAHPSLASNELRDQDLMNLKKLGTVAFAVSYCDSLLFEQYFEGSDRRSASNSFSVAKSVISLLIGKAIDDGLIGSVDDPVAKYLEEFKEDGREKITIRHLLTMSSGLDWDESGSSPMSDNAEAYYGWNLRKQMFSIKPKNAPGEIFEYASCNTQFLGFILKEVTGKSVSEYLEEKLWKPLGMETEALWNLDDKDGDEKVFCCLYATARDYLRIGRLMLNNGNWNGVQLFPANWIIESTTPANLKNEKGEPNTVYGLSWWIDEYKGLKFYYARGILGQYIICLPAYDMVIFRAGHQRGEKTDNDHPEDIYWYIDAALAMLPS